MLRDLLEQPGLYELKSGLLSFGRRSVRNYLRRTVSLREAARVLDVGCGPGRHAETFAGRYVGVDINMSYTTYASHKQSGRFACMDGAALAFSDGMFDLVFCVGLLHHLPDAHALRVLDEMKRCTAPGGQVCVVEAVTPSKRNVLGRLLFGLDRGRHRRDLHGLGALLAERGFHCRTPHIPDSLPYCRACFIWEKP